MSRHARLVTLVAVLRKPQSEEPIIYVGFYHKPKRVVNFKWSDKKRGIRSFERYGRTFLYERERRQLSIRDKL